MKHSSRFTMAFILVMVGFTLAYIINVSIFPKFPNEADLPNYSTALLQAETPTLYSRDPVFKDGVFTNMIWSSSYLYMRLFQFLHNASYQNISTTLALLQFIPAFLCVLSFYWFLSIFEKNRWLTLMLSVGLSVWLILGRSEGIPSIYYFACIPVFLRLLWQFLSKPSLDQQPVVLWQVVAIGMLIGISPLLVNSVNGLAFNILTLCLITTQFLAGRMKWQSYAALLMGLVPLLVLVALSGTGGGTNSLKDLAAAQYLVDRIPTTSLLGEWRTSFISHGVTILFTPEQSWAYYLPMTVSVVLASLWMRFGSRVTQGHKILFVFLSWCLWFFTLGNVGLILFFFFLTRFAMKRETRMDYMMITALNIGVFIGPVLLWITLGVWNVIHWNTLVFIMAQMFRFHYLTFFLSSVALLFMVDQLTEKLVDPIARYLIQLTLVLLIVVQSYEHLAISLYFLVFFGVVSVFLMLSYSKRALFQNTRFKIQSPARALGMVGVVVGGAIIIMIGAFWVTWGSVWNTAASGSLDLGSLIAADQNNQKLKEGIQQDYLDMTEWLRVNTPLDSLVYLDQVAFDRSGFFRYLTQRALLITWMDEYVGQYSNELAERNRQLLTDLRDVPVYMVSAPAALYDVNYIVMHTDHPILLPAWEEDTQTWYVPRLVYGNKTYNIFAMDRLSVMQILGQMFSAG